MYDIRTVRSQSKISRTLLRQVREFEHAFFIDDHTTPTQLALLNLNNMRKLSAREFQLRDRKYRGCHSGCCIGCCISSDLAQGHTALSSHFHCNAIYRQVIIIYLLSLPSREGLSLQHEAGTHLDRRSSMYALPMDYFKTIRPGNSKAERIHRFLYPHIL